MKNINEKPGGVKVFGCSCSGSSSNTTIELRTEASQWFDDVATQRAYTGYSNGDVVGNFAAHNIVYIFNDSATTADNGGGSNPAILIPDNITPSAPGRWVESYRNNEFALIGDMQTDPDPMDTGSKIVSPIMLQNWINDYFNDLNAVYFDSGIGDVNYNGLTPNRPKASLAQAITLGQGTSKIIKDLTRISYNETCYTGSSFGLIIDAPNTTLSVVDNTASAKLVYIQASSNLKFERLVFSSFGGNDAVIYSDAAGITYIESEIISTDGDYAIYVNSGIVDLKVKEIVGDIYVASGATLYLECLNHTGSITGAAYIKGRVGNNLYPPLTYAYSSDPNYGIISELNYNSSGLTLPKVTTSNAGLSSAADKTKLDGIEALADVTNIELTNGSETTLHTHADPVVIAIAGFTAEPPSTSTITVPDVRDSVNKYDGLKYLQTRPTWVGDSPYTEGDIIIPTIATEYSYICISAGTSGGSEPSPWRTAFGGEDNDGGVTWKCIPRYDYAIIESINATTITISGNILLTGAANIEELYYIPFNFINIIDYDLSADSLDAATNTDVLVTEELLYRHQPKRLIVAMRSICTTQDTGANSYANLESTTNDIFTANSGKGVEFLTDTEDFSGITVDQRFSLVEAGYDDIDTDNSGSGDTEGATLMLFAIPLNLIE